jgi:hypothetical protein
MTGGDINAISACAYDVRSTFSLSASRAGVASQSNGFPDFDWLGDTRQSNGCAWGRIKSAYPTRQQLGWFV